MARLLSGSGTVTGTGALTSIAPGADGQVLTSTGTVWNSEAAAGGGFDSLARQLTHHHQAGARRAAPALLRCADEHVHAAGLHIDPDRTGSDAVEHQHTAHRMHGVRHGTYVIVG